MIDRKSTRLNSSHGYISYAVFCLKNTAPTAIYTLSLHDALPICEEPPDALLHPLPAQGVLDVPQPLRRQKGQLQQPLARQLRLLHLVGEDLRRIGGGGVGGHDRSEERPCRERVGSADVAVACESR